jgi:ParB family chromosome partitioning protein
MDLKRPSGQTVSDILGKDMATIARELNDPGITNEIKLNGIELNVNEIIIKDRKRQADDEKVDEIIKSVKEIGLLNPISVNKTDEGYVLIAGLHRLTAYKRLGYNRIQAVIVNMDDIHSELAEIDENLVRAELHYLDRAEMLKRRQEIYEKLYPDFAKSEKVKKNLKQFNSTENETVSFSDKGSNNESLNGEKKDENFVSDTAKKTGLSERTVQQDLQLAKNLDKGVKEKIKKNKISKGDALKIAREKKEKQAELLKNIADTPKAKPADNSTIGQNILSLKIGDLIEKFNSLTQVVRINSIDEHTINIWTENPEILKDIIAGIKKY